MDLSAQTRGNLLRNPNFKLRWVSAEGFDHWNSRMPSSRLGGPKPVREWESEKIPLQVGTTYRLSVRWKADVPATEGPDVFVRTKAKSTYDSPPTDSAILTPGKIELTLTGSAEAAWAQVIVRMRGLPDAALESVSLHALP